MCYTETSPVCPSKTTSITSPIGLSFLFGRFASGMPVTARRQLKQLSRANRQLLFPLRLFWRGDLSIAVEFLKPSKCQFPHSIPPKTLGDGLVHDRRQPSLLRQARTRNCRVESVLVGRKEGHDWLACPSPSLIGRLWRTAGLSQGRTHWRPIN